MNIYISQIPYVNGVTPKEPEKQSNFSLSRYSSANSPLFTLSSSQLNKKQNISNAKITIFDSKYGEVIKVPSNLSDNTYINASMSSTNTEQITNHPKLEVIENSPNVLYQCTNLIKDMKKDGLIGGYSYTCFLDLFEYIYSSMNDIRNFVSAKTNKAMEYDEYFDKGLQNTSHAREKYFIRRPHFKNIHSESKDKEKSQQQLVEDNNLYKKFRFALSISSNKRSFEFTQNVVDSFDKIYNSSIGHRKKSIIVDFARIFYNSLNPQKSHKYIDNVVKCVDFLLSLIDAIDDVQSDFYSWAKQQNTSESMSKSKSSESLQDDKYKKRLGLKKNLIKFLYHFKNSLLKLKKKTNNLHVFKKNNTSSISESKAKKHTIADIINNVSKDKNTAIEYVFKKIKCTQKDGIYFYQQDDKKSCGIASICNVLQLPLEEAKQYFMQYSDDTIKCWVASLSSFDDFKEKDIKNIFEQIYNTNYSEQEKLEEIKLLIDGGINLGIDDTRFEKISVDKDMQIIPINSERLPNTINLDILEEQCDELQIFRKLDKFKHNFKDKNNISYEEQTNFINSLNKEEKSIVTNRLYSVFSINEYKNSKQSIIKHIENGRGVIFSTHREKLVNNTIAHVSGHYQTIRKKDNKYYLLDSIQTTPIKFDEYKDLCKYISHMDSSFIWLIKP